MKITCLQPAELSTEQIAAWEDLQQSNAVYDSPFFSPHFTCAVALARSDVRVTVIEDEGRWGFFPFQANRWGVGRAVGWRLNDFQGAIVADGMHVNPREWLVASGLRSWRFDHLVPGDGVERSCAFSQRQSPVIDLRDGFAAYSQSRHAAGSDAVKQTWRKERKLSREIDEVRLEVHCASDTVMSELAAWKTAQLRRSGSLAIFHVDWMRRAIEHLRHSQTDGCRGQLSALYAGDRLVAAHLGLRSRDVLHWWITAYNPEYESYSPGSIMLLRLAEAAAAENARRIDLGKGDEIYKQRFMTSATLVGEGTLCASPLGQLWHRVLYDARELARASLMNSVLRNVKRVVRAATLPHESP